MKFIHEVSTTVVYFSVIWLMWRQSASPVTIKTVYLSSFLFYCCCSSQRHFPFSWYFLSGINFEMLTVFYLSLKLKLLSNASPKRQNLSTYHTTLKKKSGNESQAGSWFVKPLDSGSAYQSRLCSWIESILCLSSFACQQLRCLLVGSAVSEHNGVIFWTVWSMKFACVQDILAKSCLCVKSLLAS